MPAFCMPHNPPNSYMINKLIVTNSVDFLYAHIFEGVCLTRVILTPCVCGGGVRAAVPDTTLPGYAVIARIWGRIAGVLVLVRRCSDVCLFAQKMMSNLQTHSEDGPQVPEDDQRTAKRNPRVPQEEPKGQNGVHETNIP